MNFDRGDYRQSSGGVLQGALLCDEPLLAGEASQLELGGVGEEQGDLTEYFFHWR